MKTGIHSHQLVSVGISNSVKWHCDGTDAKCFSNHDPLLIVRPEKRYKCSIGCDFNLCLNCVKYYMKNKEEIPNEVLMVDIEIEDNMGRGNCVKHTFHKDIWMNQVIKVCRDQLQN